MIDRTDATARASGAAVVDVSGRVVDASVGRGAVGRREAVVANDGRAVHRVRGRTVAHGYR